MSQRSDDAPTLEALALCVDDFLLQPRIYEGLAQMTSSYLDARATEGAETIPFPRDPDPEGYDVVAPEAEEPETCTTLVQAAAALVALHAVYCPGVARGVTLPAASLPDTESELPGEGTTSDFRRAVIWTSLLERVRGLGPHSLHWFKLQYRRIECGMNPITPPRDDVAGSGTSLNSSLVQSTPNPKRVTKIAEAIALKRLIPHLTDKEIASKVGCHPSTLSGSQEYRAARDAIAAQSALWLKKANRHRGSNMDDYSDDSR